MVGNLNSEYVHSYVNKVQIFVKSRSCFMYIYGRLVKLHLNCIQCSRFQCISPINIAARLTLIRLYCNEELPSVPLQRSVRNFSFPTKQYILNKVTLTCKVVRLGSSFCLVFGRPIGSEIINKLVNYNHTNAYQFSAAIILIIIIIAPRRSLSFANVETFYSFEYL